MYCGRVLLGNAMRRATSQEGGREGDEEVKSGWKDKREEGRVVEGT